MKSRPGLLLLAALAPALPLGGCSSNKGETISGPPAAPIMPTNPIAGGFTSFSAASKPGTSNLPGITTETSYNAPAPSFVVTSPLTPAQGTGSASLTLDASGNLTAITINGVQSSVTFSATNGSLALIGSPNATGFQSADRKNLAIVANPAGFGFDYQSFGIWVTGRDTGSGNFGAMSAGAVTQNTAIPTTGTATYNGSATGLYVDPAGQTFLAAGSATLTTDFAAHSVNYATSATAAVSSSATGGLLANPAVLNMQGNLSYAAASNDFSGSVSTSGMNGSAKGRFYGPAANEAGGTFALTGSGVQAYMGAFGAKK